MKTSLPAIAVLLTCHNRREKTLRCLKHLFEQEGMAIDFSMDVFLVDDGSTDGTSAAVQAEFAEVHIIQGDGNLYWTRGMHLAWKTAEKKQGYDFYLWLNDDTNIFSNAILTMMKSYYSSGNDSIICGATKSEITHEYTYGAYDSDKKIAVPNGQIQECMYINGNVVLVSQQIFQRVGFIDKKFIHAIGDYDYGLRAIKSGIRIFMPPTYVGYCEAHERLPRWCLADVPLRERMRSLYSPLGNCHPYYFFMYENRHFGLWVAMKHYFSIHLRMFMPFLWK
ncbi:MAG TPA: glycosyltransferase family 2 protein [Chitinophagaceae bacterium]|nr:glycosyltransferase family 2 protein [Chitinophagaceae bacterium]